MGFFHQLRLLLWKNLTLKKRSPFVLLFEVFIPLVLFVILLLIRKKLPASPISASRYHAKPLPSAGLVSLLQMFCEGGQRDHHGFMNFSNSRATQKFLNQLQVVAESHNFFNPGFTPQEMDELPDLYRSVINDPAFLHDAFVNASDVNMEDVLRNENATEDFMTNTLGIPDVEVEALLHSSIHVKQVYRFLFGNDLNQSYLPLLRFRRSVPGGGGGGLPDLSSLSSLSPDIFGPATHTLHPPALLNTTSLPTNGLGTILAAEFDGIFQYLKNSVSTQVSTEELIESVVRKLLENRALLGNGDMLTVLKLLLHTVESQGKAAILQPADFARLLKMALLSPQVLKAVACDKDTFTGLIVPAPPYNITQQQMDDLQQRLCALNTSQLTDLSSNLSAEIPDQQIIDILNLKPINLSATATKVEKFVDKVERFIQFQRELEELGKFVDMLPFQEPHPDSVNQTVVVDPTDNSTSPLGPDDPVTPTPNKHWKPSLLRIWSFMQTAVCGKEKEPKNKQGVNSPDAQGDEEDGGDDPIDIDSLRMSSRQKEMLGIIMHYLYSNPKILYAPNNTAADEVIKKANTTFQFIDSIGDYAREWLSISQELHDFLHEPKTEHNLMAIKEEERERAMHN